jgi:hypothetical protein
LIDERKNVSGIFCGKLGIFFEELIKTTTKNGLQVVAYNRKESARRATTRIAQQTFAFQSSLKLIQF